MEKHDEVEVIEVITLECTSCGSTWTIIENELYVSLDSVCCPECKNKNFDIIG